MLTRLIAQAHRRIVLVAPGISLPIALALADRWPALGPDAVTIVLDVDPEVFRIGYGTIEALAILESTAAGLGTMLRRQPGVRLGLLIVDDDLIVFAPTPLLVEAGGNSKQPRPNAIRLSGTPEGLARDLGIGPQGCREQAIGLDKADRARIGEVAADLKAIPPQSFDLARALRVFTSRLEFVEFRLEGCLPTRRTLTIPSELVGLADEETKRLLRSSFRLLDGAETVDWVPQIRRIRDFIARKYLISLPGYGQAIRTADKRKFTWAVNRLSRMLANIRARRQSEMQAMIDERLSLLHAALLPAVKASPPPRWRGRLPGFSIDEALRDALARLAGSARSMLAEAKITAVFKGVTYETLRDPAFIKAARQALPDLPRLHEEFDAAPGRAGMLDVHGAGPRGNPRRSWGRDCRRPRAGWW